MKSFFDKLTGSNSSSVAEDDLIDLREDSVSDRLTDDENEENQQDGELAVDVFDAGDKIILKTIVAGVKPEDLDISITRDKVTIRGTRVEESEISKNDYHQRELYWGSFSRTVMLPTEIDINESEAIEKHGLLILTLPKVDKERKTQLKVRT